MDVRKNSTKGEITTHATDDINKIEEWLEQLNEIGKLRRSNSSVSNEIMLLKLRRIGLEIVNHQKNMNLRNPLDKSQLFQQRHRAIKLKLHHMNKL